MAEYVEWADKNYTEIPKQDMPQDGDVFICLVADGYDFFCDWRYCVGIGDENSAHAIGGFKKIDHARKFAQAL